MGLLERLEMRFWRCRGRKERVVGLSRRRRRKKSWVWKRRGERIGWEVGVDEGDGGDAGV